MNKKSKNSGRTILVVGGSRGIGKRVAEILASAGDKVVVTGRAESSSGDQHQYRRLDINDKQFPLIGDEQEVLDGLVYCPGTIRLKPFHLLKDRDFLEDFETNALGAVRVIRYYLPSLKKAAHGSSVVLCSTVAVQSGMRFHSSIAAAKGAVEGLTRSLAAEYAPHIRVNAVAPSLTETDLSAGLLSSEDKRKKASDKHPLKRIGHADDVAQCVAFLLGEGSSWMTGQILHPDGGISAIINV